MNIFVLDDDIERLKKFIQAIPSAITAETVNQAKECLLKCDEWDHVFLDHDLGGRVFVDSSEYETGMTVVNWMIEQKIKAKSVTVHSLNHPAANSMRKKLLDAGYTAECIPFICLRL